MYVVMVGIVELVGVCSHGGDCGPHGRMSIVMVGTVDLMNVCL